MPGTPSERRLVAHPRAATYPCSIRGCASVFVVVSHFVKVVLVQLTDEAGKVAMLEMLRKDVFGKFLILCDPSAKPRVPKGNTTNLQHYEAVAFVAPPDYALVLRAFEHSTWGVN